MNGSQKNLPEGILRSLLRSSSLETGQPQKYGTQFQAWKLRLPIDPTTTDEERAKFGVPPLAEAEKRIKEKYGIKD